VDKTTLPVPVSSEITPANSEDVVAESASNLSVVTTNVFELGMVLPFMLVAVASPKTGVIKIGEVAKTAEPVPVSSVTAPDKFAEVKEPKEAILPTEVTIPFKLALIVFAAVTNAVVASWVVFVPDVAVGARGVPVNAGEAKEAFKAKASKTAFCDGAIVVVPSLITSATEAPTAVDTASPTKAVVAIAVELLPEV